MLRTHAANAYSKRIILPSSPLSAPCNNCMSGLHTAWSWNVVRSCCTLLESECKHLTAAKRTRDPPGSWRPETTCSIKLSVSIIRLRMSSSLAPRDANALNAACRMSCVNVASCTCTRKHYFYTFARTFHRKRRIKSKTRSVPSQISLIDLTLLLENILILVQCLTQCLLARRSLADEVVTVRLM